MGNPRDGIILVDKGVGESSFDVVRKIKKALGIKKVGHAGTLDPFATGLLIVLVRQGTKLAPYLMSGKKTYRGTLRLGVETDTQDPTGQTVSTRPVPEISLEEIRRHALGFIGEIEQVPPAFSAVKHQGKRAYEFARKGIAIDLKKRRVRIHSLEVLGVSLPEITFQVVCSGGTYVRTLAADLGKQMGPGAHLRELRRLGNGPFRVQDALHSEEIETPRSRSVLEDGIIPLRNALPDMAEVHTDGVMAKRIRNGYHPGCKELAGGSKKNAYLKDFVKIVSGREMIAIAEGCASPGEDKVLFKVQRVFN
ncbi:MAG: tRNA pseudouridine(55) synthase TruB [Deltaproteobacteria bacterium]|nr:tRNA pseudouridine(55) synthase TruB [Deltaproteobacteria bacterium]MBW2208247.1 tRNA pseudouridine(55) synthase TruB [Deltaproteobacteria bacterium]